MEHSNHPKTTFEQDFQQSDFFRNFAIENYQRGNWGLSKHFYLIACDTILSQRFHCSAQERLEREKVAKRLISEAKMVKAKMTEKLNRLLSSDAQARSIHENILEKAGEEVRFSAIVGLENAKAFIMESLVYPSRRPDIFSGVRSPSKGILLYGPPGNGKTMLARAIANECQAKFFNISASTILSKFVGESQKMLRALFSLARLVQPSIIFFDEVDSLLSARSQGEAENVRQVKTEFLLQFEGVASSKDEWVFLVGATNRPSDLDSAVLRRFEKKVLVDVPTQAAREKLIKQGMEGVQCGMKKAEIKAVAKQMEGYSSSDVMAVVREASMIPVRALGGSIMNTRLMDVPGVGKKDFLKAISQIRPCCSKEEVEELRRWGGRD